MCAVGYRHDSDQTLPEMYRATLIPCALQHRFEAWVPNSGQVIGAQEGALFLR